MDYIKVKRGRGDTWTKVIPLPERNINIDSVVFPPIKYNGRVIPSIKQSISSNEIELYMPRPEILKWQYDYDVVISYQDINGYLYENKVIHSDSFLVIHEVVA